MKVKLIALFLITVGLSWIAISIAHAQSSSVTIVPQSSFYAGVGGSYNSVNFGAQNVYAVGTSNNYTNNVLTSSGSAWGPTSVNMGKQTAWAPTLQAGYFQYIADTHYLWGAKVTYSYLGASSTVQNANIPQVGNYYYPSSNKNVSFVGNAVANSYQTTMNNQLQLMPFFGHSFNKGFAYIGGGPTISQVKTNINNLVGYATINGVNTNISGAPQSFSSSSWVYGAAALVGATYFLSPSWFLDLSYTYTQTNNQIGNYSSAFSNPANSSGASSSGTLVGNSSGKVLTQSIALTINKSF